MLSKNQNLVKIFSTVCLLFFILPNFSAAQDIDSLNTEIKDKQSEIEEVKKKAAI